LREEAQADQDFVGALCAALGVPLNVGCEDITSYAETNRMGIEEAAREARYTFLEQVRQECGAEILLVGHQCNDLAEDQLMRLSRGCGWPALGGMTGWDERRRLLRPLLLTPRADLENFLLSSGLSWRTDASNFNRLAARNRVRHDLLPGVLAENPAYLTAATRLWRQASVDEAHWQGELREALALCHEAGDVIEIPVSLLRASSSAKRLRLFKHILDRLGPGQALSDTLFELDALCSEHRTGKGLFFPGDKESKLYKSGLRFRVIDRKKECR
jgi:tRNA(Ile)-lysidine synthase